MGIRTERHHPIPKAKGGRETVPVHPICHRAIHAHLSNGQLQRIGADVGTLRDDPGIASFLQWVVGKPPDFYAPTRRRQHR